VVQLIITQIDPLTVHKLDMSALMHHCRYGYIGSNEKSIFEYAARTSGPDGMQNTGLWSPRWWDNDVGESDGDKKRESTEIEIVGTDMLRESLHRLVEWKKKMATHSSILQAFSSLEPGFPKSWSYDESLKYFEGKHKTTMIYRHTFAEEMRQHMRTHFSERAIIDMCVSFCFDLRSCLEPRFHPLYLFE
jgi:hypothetical protein